MKLILPGSIRSKKNSKKIIAIPSKHETGLFKYFGKKVKTLRPVRTLIKPSDAYEEWEREARRAVILQLKVGHVPVTYPIHVTAIAYIRGQEPDRSGMMESVGDALEGLVWENDKQIKSWDGSRVYRDKDNPRTEVTVEPYMEA